MNRTLIQARKELMAAFRSAPDGAKMSAYNEKRKEILSSGMLEEVNPYNNNYTIYPKGYVFDCGTQVFSDWASEGYTNSSPGLKESMEYVFSRWEKYGKGVI